jgi:hydrogenase maturation factor
MASETFIGPLLRVSLFQGLSQPQLAGLARRAERVMFRIGQTIIKAGDAGDGAFLLIVGEGGIVDADRLTHSSTSQATRGMAVVETGSLIGEMTMLIDTEYSTKLAAHFVAKIAARLREFTDELRLIESGLEPPQEMPTTPPAIGGHASAYNVRGSGEAANGGLQLVG